MKIKISFIIFIVIIKFPLFSQTVDELELESIEKDIEFQNYQGISDKFETRTQISNIGRELGNAINDTQRLKYQVQRVIETKDDTNKLGADIIRFLSDSRVDHIDNVRRIIAGYLEEVFDYNFKQAQIIARFITIYNAVYRQDITILDKYIPEVKNAVSLNSLGLSVSYKEWPGSTEIIIPLSIVNGIIRSDVLIDSNVIEQLNKDEPENNLEIRKDMLDSVSEELNERQEVLDVVQKELNNDQEELDDIQKELDKRLDNALTDNGGNGDAVDEANETTVIAQANLEEEQKKIDTQQQALTNEQENVANKTAEINEMQNSLDTMRQDLAQDIAQELSDTSNSYMMVQTSVNQNGLLNSFITLADNQTQKVVGDTTIDLIVNRMIINSNPVNFALQKVNADIGHIISFNDMLAIENTSDDIVSIWSMLISDTDSLFAVTKKNASWILTRFTTDLNVAAQSEIFISPYTYIDVMGNNVIVEGFHGESYILDKQTLQ